MGGVIGGIVGQNAASGARGQANNDLTDANNIIQNLQNAPPQSRPVLLEQYRQAGIINPQNEAIIQQKTSNLAGIQGNQAAKDAQMQALKSLTERSIGGLNAADRAGLNQAREQSQTDQRAKQAQIMQEFAQRGQGGMGAELAAKLSSSQNGANAESAAADRLAQMANQNALQATAQLGGLGGQVENQAFSEAGTRANAADEMNRFNIQNQIAQQARNTGAQNQAQYANLANLQNVNNQNVGMTNQEAYRQRQGEQQDFNNANNLANMKANSLTGRANSLNQMGQQEAQGYQNIGSGFDSAILGGVKAMYGDAGAMGSKSSQGQRNNQNNYNEFYGSDGGRVFNDGIYRMSDGGSVKDFTGGGHVDGEEVVPGDDPRNDTVDAKLSPGEIVVPKSVAQTSLGDKLLDLLKHHHEIKTHLDGIEKKASKKKHKFADGGKVADDSLMSAIQRAFSSPPPPEPPRESLEQKNERIRRENFERQSGNRSMGINEHDMSTRAYADGGQVGFDDSFAEKFKKGSGFADGGQVEDPSLADRISKLISSNPQQIPVKPQPQDMQAGMRSAFNYADGTSDGNPVPSLEDLYSQYNQIGQTAKPVNFEEGSVIKGDAPEQPIDLDQVSQNPSLEDKQKQLADIKGLDQKFADEEKQPASREVPVKESTPSEESDDEEESSDEESKPKQFDSSNNALAEAQKKRSMYEGLNDIAKGGTLMGAGIAHSDPSQGLNTLNSLSKDKSVESFQEQVKNQVNDPNSTMTDVMRSYLENQGMKVPENASAADMLKVAPFLAKDKALQAKIQAAILASQTKQNENEKNRNFKGSEGEKNRASGEKKAAMTAGTRKEIADMNLTGRDISKIEQDPTIKKANDRINSASSALTQLHDKSQPLTMNRLNAIQIDLANTLNFMSSQGASDYKAKSDKLENLNTMIAAAKQKYGTSLVDLRKEAPEVYNEVTKYAQSVKDSVQKIKDAQEQNLAKKYSHAGLGKSGEAIKDIYKPKADQSAPAVDADLSKMSPEELKAYIEAHGK